MIQTRSFPTLALFQERQRAGESIGMSDPLRIAAIRETEAREWYRQALNFAKSSHAGAEYSAEVALRTCDELLDRGAETLAAAAEEADHAA